MWIMKECKLLGTTLLPRLQIKNMAKQVIRNSGCSDLEWFPLIKKIIFLSENENRFVKV